MSQRSLRLCGERLFDRYTGLLAVAFLASVRTASTMAISPMPLPIAWVLGRYDRPWPSRPVFGTVRYMSSASAKRKLKMTRFLAHYGLPR